MDLFCAEISEEITHRLVVLRSAADIARFSFVAQNSISYLNLSLQEKISFIHDKRFFGISTSSVLHSDIQYPKYLINTEEKCRNILSRTRGFLYRLHLDLPLKREYNFNDIPEIKIMSEDSCHRHIGKIIIDPNFHFTVLSCLVKEAVERSDKKLKLIKWFLTFDAVKENVVFKNEHALYFSKYMHPEIADSTLVMAFLKKLDFSSWIIHNDRPELLEYFLYNLCRKENVFLHKKVSRFSMIDECIFEGHFFKIEIILKYKDAPGISIWDVPWFFCCHYFKRQGLTQDVLREARKLMSPRRFHLLIQFLYIYFRKSHTKSVECLRLLWNSVPDAIFSFEEIKMALQACLSSETIRDIYNFYSGVVGVFIERAEPRSLKDLCRPIVRRMLFDSCCWIPDGIKQIDVPRELQSFLNLEY